ncbi:MAG TPA: sialidase family protein [Candidatus Thermoplasmatota archaeon]|nr:sialidase family protein [Candidatus Thermoplasmatota archaeon]
MHWSAFAAAAALLLAGCAATIPAALPAPPPALEAVCLDPCRVPVGRGMAWEPHAAVHPHDPQHILVGSSSFGFGLAETFEAWAYAHTSLDGGATWTTVRMPGGPGTDPRHAMAPATHLGDPIVGFLPDGTAVYLGLMTTGAAPAQGMAGAWSGLSLFLARSPDGGRTWPEASIVPQGEGLSAWALLLYAPVGEQRSHDRPAMAIGPDGTILVTWGLLGDDTRLTHASSTDGGRTWSPYRPIDTQRDASAGHPLMASDGAWHVAYMAWEDPQAFRENRFGLHFATSRDRGASWDIQHLGATAFFPFLAEVPGSGGQHLLLAYPEALGEGVEVPVLRASLDAGATWSAPVQLDGPAGPGQTLPTLAVDGDGVAWVSHFRNGAPTTYHAVPVDPHTLAAGQAVRLDADVGADPSLLGHYMGLAPLPKGVFAAWTSQAEGEAVFGATATLAATS